MYVNAYKCLSRRESERDGVHVQVHKTVPLPHHQRLSEKKGGHCGNGNLLVNQTKTLIVNI